MVGRAQGESQRDQERLIALATGLTHVMYVLRLDGSTSVRYISDSLAAFVGYRPQEFIEDPDLALSVVHPDDLRAAAATIGRARLGEVVQFTVRVTTRDGRTIWTHHRCCKEHDAGGGTVLYGAARNDTEHVARARELAAREQRLRLILENVSDVVFDIAPEHVLTWVSASVRDVLGWDPLELIGRTTRELIHPDDQPLTDAARDATVAGVARASRLRVLCSDGSYRWMSAVSRDVTDEDGVLLGRVAGMHDVDDIVRAEAAIAESERYFRVLAENSADIVFRGTAEGPVEWVSPSVTDILGYQPQDLLGNAADELLHPDDRLRVDDTRRQLQAGKPLHYEARFRRADGIYRWLDVHHRPVLDDEGRVIGRVGNARDIHDEVMAREQLIDSERRSRRALELAPVGTAVADMDRRFVQVNAALCRMLDRDETWLLSHGIADVLAETFDEVDQRLRDEVRLGRAITARGETMLVRADGSLLWVEHSVALLRDEGGRPQSYVCQFVDITEAKEGREQLSFQARHDSLTNLLTRSALMEGLDRIESHDPRRGTRLGVLYIDLDNLKQINDELGHAAGDAVLVHVADRISATARSGDIVARIGGDEIVVILPDVREAADAEAVAKKIRRALEPVAVGGAHLVPKVSIGVAVAGPDDDARAVIGHADHALYRAKRSGRNLIMTYDPRSEGPGGGA